MTDQHSERPPTGGRSGASKRGRPATEPCGTRAAWRRHRRNGEDPCDACEAALSRWNADQYRKATTTGAGLEAAWLNGWLAAVGATMLVPGLRLAWTAGGSPTAVFHHARGLDVAAAVTDVLPDPAAILKIAGRVDTGDNPFVPGVPAGLGLVERAVNARKAIDDPAAAVAATLAGAGSRVRGNGLGFDYRRIPDQQGEAPMVDPVVELLALAALEMFPPVRRWWDGDWHPGRRCFGGRAPGAKSAGVFWWTAWTKPLERWAIDAWLDEVDAVIDPALTDSIAERSPMWDAVGATVMWRSLRFSGRGTKDPTRGFASALWVTDPRPNAGWFIDRRERRKAT